MTRRPALAAALLGLSAGALAAAPPPPVPEVLEDGSELLVVPLPAASWSSLRLVVRAGGAQDPDGKGGAARLLARTILDSVADERGTKLEELVRRAGGTVTFRTTPSATIYALDAPSAKYQELAGAVIAHVTSPRFSLVDLQKEVPLLNTEPLEPRGALAGWARLEHLLFPPTDPNSPVDGTPLSREHLERDDLVAFFGKNYLTTAVTTVFAGAISLEQAKGLVEQSMRLPPAIPDDRPSPAKIDPASLPLTEKQTGPQYFAAVGFKLDRGRRHVCETFAKVADAKVAVAVARARKAAGIDVRCWSVRGQDFVVASAPVRSPDPYAFPDAVERALKDAAKAPPRPKDFIRVQQGAQRALELLAESPPDLGDALAAEASVPRASGGTDVSAVFFKPALAWGEVKDLAKKSFREDRMFQLYLSPPAEK